MEKRRLLKPGLLIAVVALTIISFAVTRFIQAKYVGSTEMTGEVNLEAFDVSLQVEAPSGLTVDSSGSGVIELTAAEYEKFALSVKKTGAGWAYIRVLIEESWIYTDSESIETVRISAGGVLQCDTSVVEPDEDYFYVKGIVKEPSDAITIIKGGNSLPDDIPDKNFPEDYKVKLSIKLEAIQYNRRAALWGV